VTAREALRPVRLGYHWLRDRVHFAQRPGFRAGRVVRGAFDSAEIAERMRRDGVCILHRYLEGERLATVQRAAGALLEAIPGGARGKHDFNHMDLARHPLFAELILDELVLAAFEEYYGRELYVADCKLQRHEPTTPYEERSFRWHHDGKGKYVKTMWLLTDVPPDGQRMSYVAGSHRRWKAALTYEETRFTDAGARRLGQVVECAGEAGSVVLFDTNGIHRGNRNLGPRRDVLFGFYSAGRHLSGCRVDTSDLPWCTPRQRAVLERSGDASHGYGGDRGRG
jgi:hypothetical protein